MAPVSVGDKTLLTRTSPCLSVGAVAKRERYLFVCINRRPDGTPKGCCAVRGAVEIHAKLKALLKERGLASTRVRPCTSSCLDTCWAGPAISVMPDGYFYGRVTLEDVEEIVSAFERGERVERLVLEPKDFIEPKALNKLGLSNKGS